MNLVIIPTWNRPEFLAVTIDHILAAENSENQLYIFIQDAPEDKDVSNLIRQFPYFNHYIKIQDKRYEGNIFALGSALKYADEMSDSYLQSELVYVVEEDVWIGKDFFNFHESVHKQFQPFAISSVYNHYRKRQDFEGRADFLYTDKSFQGVGVSINKKFLGEITKHFTKEYYNSPFDYCEKVFPKSKIPHPDWDGLCGKVMNQLGESCIYPFVPRSFHAGYYGIHRQGNRPSGISLSDRIRNLRLMDDQIMNEITNIKDIRKPDLEATYCISDFSLQKVPDYKYF